MDPAELVALFVPILFILVVGGLVGLRMLRPFGDRILDVLEQSQRQRTASLAAEDELARIRDRLDLLSERQEFLEALVEGRLEDRVEGQMKGQMEAREEGRERISPAERPPERLAGGGGGRAGDGGTSSAARTEARSTTGAGEPT